MERSSLPERYFSWLYAQVFPGRTDPDFGYTVACEIMHNTTFRVIVSRDENRTADGAQLRNSFLRSIGYDRMDEAELMVPGVSVFEVLVSLALKAEYMIEIAPHEMFMIFLENLAIADCYDGSNYTGIRIKISSHLRKFNNRLYSRSGRGGLFPLRRASEDQRKIELWYQMGAYMTENHMY